MLVELGPPRYVLVLLYLRVNMAHVVCRQLSYSIKPAMDTTSTPWVGQFNSRRGFSLIYCPWYSKLTHNPVPNIRGTWYLGEPRTTLGLSTGNIR